MNRTFNLNASAVKGNDVHFRNFYLNTANGTLYESDLTIQFNSNFTAVTVITPLAGFEATFIGQVAQGDVELRDLDKFWDANGRFMIEDPQQITLTQGDGKKAVITLNSTDTLRDIEFKLSSPSLPAMAERMTKVPATDSGVLLVSFSMKSANRSVLLERYLSLIHI